MSGPFVLISTSFIKEGKLDEYKAFSSPMVLLPTFSKENSP